MIKKYDNVLEEKLIENIMEYFKTIIHKDVWSSSNSWDQNLCLKSSNIITHTITNNFLCDEIKKCIENKLNINFEQEKLEFIPSIYVWGSLSYINWHNDNNYVYSGTIYLNKNWNSNDGGIFLYKDNQTDQILGLTPDYNSMVINFNNESDPYNYHCVTCITPGTIKKRITIQWRVLSSYCKKSLMSYK